MSAAELKKLEELKRLKKESKLKKKQDQADHNNKMEAINMKADSLPPVALKRKG